VRYWQVRQQSMKCSSFLTSFFSDYSFAVALGLSSFKTAPHLNLSMTEELSFDKFFLCFLS
jgi:hypothetical protein